jgi:hypothetical protein
LVQHPYLNNLPDDALRNVRVKVFASDGKIANATLPIKVVNAPPRIGGLQFNAEWVTGLPLQGRVVATDPGSDDELTISIKWGDGLRSLSTDPRGASEGSYGADFTHTYRLPQPSDGNVRVAVRRFTVKVLPIARINGDSGMITLLGGTDGDDKIRVVRSSQPGSDPVRINVFINDETEPSQSVLIGKAEMLQFSMGDGRDAITVDPNLDNPLWVVTDGLDTVASTVGKLKPAAGALGVGTKGNDRMLLKRLGGNRKKELVQLLINGAATTGLVTPKDVTVMLMGGVGNDVIQGAQSLTPLLAYGGAGRDIMIATIAKCVFFGETGVDSFRNLGTDDTAKQ